MDFDCIRYLTILALKIENPFSPWGVKVKHKICTPRHWVWRRSWYAFHKCNLDLISDKRTYLYANQFWRKDWEQFPFAKYVKNLLIKDNMAGSGHPWSNQIWQTLQKHVTLLNVQSKSIAFTYQSSVIIAPIVCILPYGGRCWTNHISMSLSNWKPFWYRLCQLLTGWLSRK